MYAVLLLSLISITIDVRAMSPLCDTCDCPPPRETSQGLRIPPYADTKPKLSYDSRYLLYEPGYRLDLSTLSVDAIQATSGLAGEAILGYFSLTWAPYSSDRVILKAAMLVDTGADATGVYRQNLLGYTFSSATSNLLSPRAAGPYGPEGMNLVAQKNAPWLRGSHEGRDTLLLGYGSSDSQFVGLYSPQSQLHVPKVVNFQDAFYRESNSGNHHIWGKVQGFEVSPYYLDGIEIGFPVKPDQVTWGSFSPDGKLFALDVWPERVDTNKTYRQVWIYRTEDPSTPIHRLNFQELFCKYSFHGIWPEFITDSTLAVSMHKDGDISSPLWEITIDGRIVRQLTFLPTNSVVRDESTHSTSYALLASDKATITVKPSSKDRQVTLINTLGQEVLSERIASSAEQIVLNVRSLPPGSYFCKLRGESELIRIVVQR
jgi:hypothetical protein